MSAASIIELREVSKSFGSTQALREVSFDLAQGEVHALTGENGAGKSTLIKIISGVHTDYTGELYLDGRLHRFRSPEDAAHAGVASIHQELSLVGSMTVADNLLLGETGAAYGIWPGRAGRQATRRILSSVDLDLDPEQFVETLPLSIRQLIEIARALGRNARVLVMDEPTSALNQREASALFERIDRLRARGTSIIYISHRMEEIYRLADRITVLRDGMRVATAPLGELPKSALIEKMVGKPLTSARETRRSQFGEPVLTVRNLSVEDPRRPGQQLVDSISFTLRRGEILGLAGLVGSGASELLHALFGSLKTRKMGEIELAGQKLDPSPEHSIKRSLVLLANDRSASIVAALSVADNATLSSLSRFSRYGWVSRLAELRAVTPAAARVKLRPASPTALVEQLSGGNQQKVAVMRCLVAQPSVLLLDEPTRGIDIAAKSDVYQLIRELAAAGVGILLVASEMEELIELCDAVLVLTRGRLAARLEREELRQERILTLAMGGETLDADLEARGAS